jgi:hypothetical protein
MPLDAKLELQVTEDGGAKVQVQGYDPPSMVIAEMRKLAFDIEQGNVILIGGVVSDTHLCCDFRRVGEKFDA